MSNALAIAAVTATLMKELNDELNRGDDELAMNVTVTALSPDRARNGVGQSNQLNLFMYQTALDAGWRNRSLPQQNRPSESGRPPLALQVNYLVTAYGEESPPDDEIRAQCVLGSAMRWFHDHPILARADIVYALKGAGLLGAQDLDRQVDSVRFTPIELSTEEMSKLWTTFQTQYHLSVAYQASVVLIESKQPSRAPLPVLRRGPDDRGPVADSAGLPILDAVRLPRNMPAAQLGEPRVSGNQVPPDLRGDSVTLTGRGLGRPGLTVQFAHSLIDQALGPASVAVGTDSQLTATLPDLASSVSTWAPGFYTVAVQFEVPELGPNHSMSSNAVAMAIAPSLTLTSVTKNPLPAQQNRAAAWNVAVDLVCQPSLRPGQRVTLLFGDRQVPYTGPIPDDPTQASALSLVVRNVVPRPPSETYIVRLRVDGVDSVPFTWSQVSPDDGQPAGPGRPPQPDWPWMPVFRDDLKVTLP
jgi:hypothetical protein